MGRGNNGGLHVDVADRVGTGLPARRPDERERLPQARERRLRSGVGGVPRRGAEEEDTRITATEPVGERRGAAVEGEVVDDGGGSDR